MDSQVNRPLGSKQTTFDVSLMVAVFSAYAILCPCSKVVWNPLFCPLELCLIIFPRFPARLANARRAPVKRNLALIWYIFTLIHF